MALCVCFCPLCGDSEYDDVCQKCCYTKTTCTLCYDNLCTDDVVHCPQGHHYPMCRRCYETTEKETQELIKEGKIHSVTDLTSLFICYHSVEYDGKVYPCKLQIFNPFSNNNAKECVICLTPECKTPSFTFSTEKSWICNKCEKENCNICFTQHGSDKGCSKKSKVIHDFERIIKDSNKQFYTKGSVRPCPNCREPLGFNGGCFRINCPKCKHSFFWLTGESWSSCIQKYEKIPLWWIKTEENMDAIQPEAYWEKLHPWFSEIKKMI